MISQARTLGAPLTVPAGKPANSASSASLSGASSADDVRDDVHDVAVEFDGVAVGDADAAGHRGAADVVAAEVEQHQMLGALLGIGEQARRGSPRPPRAVLPRGRVPAIGRIGDLAVADADEDLGARADQREAGQVEMIEEGRGVDAAQRAVELERRQREGRGEALREHDLEDVAGDDVVLARARPSPRSVRGRARACRRGSGSVGADRRRAAAWRRAARRWRRAARPPRRRSRPASRAGSGQAGATRNSASASRSKTRSTRRAGRTACRAGRAGRRRARQLLDQPDRLVAEIADQAGERAGQFGGHLDAALGDQRAQRGERRAGEGRRRRGRSPSVG